MAFGFKKEYRGSCLPKEEPGIVDVPKASDIAIRGAGIRTAGAGSISRR